MASSLPSEARPSTPRAASSSNDDVSSPVSHPLPPAQSRDATIPSRYFPPANSGNILVPSSSPLGPSALSAYVPYGHARPHDVGAIQSAKTQFQVTWDDPLTASTSFSSNNTLGRHPRDRNDVNGAEGPPRKRQNRGHGQLIDLTMSPDSPDVRGPGIKRRTVPTAGSSSDDDDFLPVADSAAGPSTSRITRNRPSPPVMSTPNVSTSSPGPDAMFLRFKITMPTESPQRIEAAWRQANHDVKKATALLTDPNWAPPTPPSVTTSSPAPRPEVVGRVREVDEATKAQRLAAKETGKRSAIYAKRPVTTTARETQFLHYTPPQPKERAVSSPAPRVIPRRKAARKIVDSDSDENYSESDDDASRGRPDNSERFRTRALEYFNSAAPEALAELTGCTPEQANIIASLRPFEDADELEAKLKQGKKKAGPGGISPKMFADCVSTFEGYGTVDSILEDCEETGVDLQTAISSWGATDQTEDGALSLHEMKVSSDKPKDYLDRQPELLADGIQLKDYQLLGVNWLNLLYRRNFSCILADEMGLGKTAQVISFLAYLKAQGNVGPHLIVVPSSTLENWCREFARFAPSIEVQTYYAGKSERPELRETLLESQRSKGDGSEGWDVLITTYNLAAQGDERDRRFFRKIEWDCCVFDEGHVLKNFQSQRYQTLLKYESKWRLLLTGTPLQNNLQELVSLMNFILPGKFSESMEALRAIFKVRGDTKVSLLSQERVSRAKKMMTPFVLRRRKDQVLKDLPKKTERVEWCMMTPLQKSIYADAIQRSRKFVLETIEDDTDAADSKPSGKKRPKAAAAVKKTYQENSSNVLMDLRKSALHPMLFRTLFTDRTLDGITKQLLKEPDFKKRGARYDYVKEDMSVMTDAELQHFCGTYKSTQKFLQDDQSYLDAGKVEALMRLLAEFREQGRKVLIFSQFTQILDILQAILKQKHIRFLVLTGSTPVDVRQSLVDEFSETDSINVFLLSTKAGGMGINLTAASVVIMFDQDFNPHNDRQAQDRAYRIGQKRDVDVIKLISRGTIEEDMLRLGETKLALDQAVGGAAADPDDKSTDDSAPEREMKTSLLQSLRKQFTDTTDASKAEVTEMDVS
ncbi:unnamed protein product [Mycena citricolor]|uniref:DNA helicase n=1 Tax=Mycena citricolor TaxID=2018698 RepID=A0AAD2HTG9_9AGAR|nr:unnamed protein product [Mycena citricolor]